MPLRMNSLQHTPNGENGFKHGSPKCGLCRDTSEKMDISENFKKYESQEVMVVHAEGQPLSNRLIITRLWCYFHNDFKLAIHHEIAKAIG